MVSQKKAVHFYFFTKLKSFVLAKLKQCGCATKDSFICTRMCGFQNGIHINNSWINFFVDNTICGSTDATESAQKWVPYQLKWV